MNIVLLVYFAGVVGNVHALLVLFSLITVVGLLGVGVILLEGKLPLYKTAVKKWLTLWVVMSLMFVLIPSEKTIYLMAGALVAQDIANNPKTTATMDKIYKIIDRKLEEQIEAISKKAEKKIEGVSK